MTTAHTAYGSLLTIRIAPISNLQFEDVRALVSSQHGDLHIQGMYGRHWNVMVIDDSDTVEREEVVSLDRVESEMYEFALQKGWTDFSWSEYKEGAFTIDLAQFDAWDLGHCVQMAAFGEVIVG